MWFKCAQIFELVDEFDLNPEQLAQELKHLAFKPCGTHDLKSLGWISPMPVQDAPLVHGAQSCLLVCLRQEEKVIPASMVKEETAARVQALENKSGKKPRKRESDEIKEDVFQGLVARALCKSSQTNAYLDTKAKWLIVDAASAKKAEDLVTLLRKSLGSFRVKRPDLQTIPTLLTHWVRSNEYPADFVIADSCQIKDLEEGGTISCKKHNLLCPEIQSLLEGPREISQLALAWQEQVSFQLNADLVVKSIRFLELIRDQANDLVTESAQDRFDADFVIMVAVLRELISSLLHHFAKPAEQASNDASSSAEAVNA